MSPRGPSARRVWIGLAALVLLAAALRWPATTRLLPHAPEPDAYVVNLAQDYRHDPALVQHVDYAERYPVLLARLLSVLPWPAPEVDPARPGAADAMLRAGSGPYQAGRWLVLAIALLAIPGTWLVARRLAGERAAWIASALVATSMLHALFSTQARPHAPQAAFGVLAVWAAMRMAERLSIGRCAAAVALASLALATLQIGASTLPPLLVAAWLAGGSRGARVGRAVLLPGLAIVGALWAYPFALNFLDHGLRLGGSGAHEVDFRAADFSGFGELARRLAEHDPALFLYAAAGLASVLVRWRASARALIRERDVTIACAFALPYLAVVGPLNEVFERFLLPLLPWIATLGAAVLVRLAGPKPGRSAAVGAIAVAAPLLLLLQFARVSAAPDSYELATRWFAEQEDSRSARVILSPGLVLPVPFEAESLRADLSDRSGRTSAWPQYQGTRPDEEFPAWRLPHYMTPGRLSQKPEEGLAAWFEGLRPRYVVLERSKKNLFLAGGRELAELTRTRGTLVFQTGGEAPGIEELGLLHYQAMDGYVRRLLRTERFGAALEVWRLEP
ncbi:MAG: glycosyltransferase family 39 protein [Planctomycetota bacterium]|nr:glycosyltransferase family 39 protein [Planctomycetota bacterium]